MNQLNNKDSLKEINIVEQLIHSNKSITEFRGALMEASRNFVPLSVADAAFKFYKAVRDFYSDLLIHEFQLYSDVPRYLFTLSGCKVSMGGDVRYFTFGSLKLNDLQFLTEFNDFPFEECTGITFDFKLVPELLYLTKEIQTDFYKDMFYKDRLFEVPVGDGSFYSGIFHPTWTDEGLSANSTSLMKSAMTYYHVTSNLY